MGYAKERGKLEKLLTKINSIEIYSEKNLAILVDSYENYSHTIRILKNKEPELFIDLYKNELQAIKEGKRKINESEDDEARQTAFAAYKVTIADAIDKTIKVSLETL